MFLRGIPQLFASVQPSQRAGNNESGDVASHRAK